MLEDLPKLPKLPPAAEKQIHKAERKAGDALVKELIAQFRGEGANVASPSSHLDLVPTFERYTKRVFEANAANYMNALPEAEPETLKTQIISRVISAIKPDKFCKYASQDEDNPRFLPESFEEMKLRSEEPVVRSVSVFDPQTEEVDEVEEEEWIDPWAGIGYSGVWEITLSRLAGIDGLGYSRYDFQWKFVRALRNPLTWLEFRDRIKAYVDATTPQMEPVRKRKPGRPSRTSPRKLLEALKRKCMGAKNKDLAEITGLSEGSVTTCLRKFVQNHCQVVIDFAQKEDPQLLKCLKDKYKPVADYLQDHPLSEG